jgi:hypothetical protein
MDRNDEGLDIETYRMAAELRRIGNRAVRNAQAENRRLGIPNAYSRRGRLYFELPSGEITEDDPFEDTGRTNGES